MSTATTAALELTPAPKGVKQPAFTRIVWKSEQIAVYLRKQAREDRQAFLDLTPRMWCVGHQDSAPYSAYLRAIWTPSMQIQFRVETFGFPLDAATLQAMSACNDLAGQLVGQRLSESTLIRWLAERLGEPSTRY